MLPLEKKFNLNIRLKQVNQDEFIKNIILLFTFTQGIQNC